MDNTKDVIENLRKQIRHHDRLYYKLCQPTISDYAYDMMFKRLQELEEQYPEFADENSPTQRPGY
jgi:DNA ligase (NAD+)